MKDAKAEAQKEIEEYRKKKDEEFKEYEAKVRSLPGRGQTSLTGCAANQRQ